MSVVPLDRFGELLVYNHCIFAFLFPTGFCSILYVKEAILHVIFAISIVNTTII